MRKIFLFAEFFWKMRESKSLSIFGRKFLGKKGGTDRLGAEKGQNLKLENFFLPLLCVIFGKKSRGK
jgi:hypothetical protein